MKAYALSLAAGLLVGFGYGILGVASPAPPFAALVGLLGILIGDQVGPVGRQLLAGAGFGAACAVAGSKLHLFGDLPGRHARPATPAEAPFPESQP